MPDPSAGEVGGIFAGVVALLIALGKAVGWLINLEDRRQSTRHAKLDAWQRELEARETRIDRQQEDYQARIEQQVADLTKWALQLQSQVTVSVNAFRTVRTALQRKDPSNPALALADGQLKKAFPVEAVMPASLVGLLSKLSDEGPKAA